tara:strand:- start:636 stop:1358 length:723 start_codon:yes stop_codon:yes gene_type:complete
MAWWMKLSNLVILFVLCGSGLVPTIATAREVRSLMSYPPCPQIEYNYCPAEVYICQMTLEQYIDSMAEAHNFDARITRLRRFEREAIEVITSAGSIGKRPYDIVRTDCGAHGLFHFQPPMGVLEWAPWDVSEVVENAGDCAYENQQWIETVDYLLHMYPYGPGYQLLEWRDRVLAAAYYASQEGWEADKMAWALAIANSTGVRGFRRILSEDPDETLEHYLAQRPGSNHRARRAEALRRL